EDVWYIDEKISGIVDEGRFEGLVVLNSDEEVSEVVKEMKEVVEYGEGGKGGYGKEEKEMGKMVWKIWDDVKRGLRVVVGYSEILVDR
ncbi:hypothetical protein, partial [Paenibacillus xylanexedens]|uniref:hypothetical protein n=1 Tax=Paenibacillus xylanexedens TaxID=528191 RepID=UPI001C92FCB2